MKLRTATLAVVLGASLLSMDSYAQEREPVRPEAQPQPAVQNAAAQSAVQNAAAGEGKVEKEVYIYNPSGRRDPLLSIITASREVETRRGRPGEFTPPTEDYDVSQFNLIAIIWAKAESHALVGLPDGKYYTLKKGLRAGINEGKVIQILPDSVIIREFVKDYKGKTTAKDTTLKLRKEEEK
ncbi:MAG: pilus assembly protein PilP [Thermodesulfovibrionales bacterium]|nr:pilus assembly protein PilP [Thermodesulfovibrionales bacterium]